MMKLPRRTMISAAVAAAMLLGGAGAALAGTTEQSYNTTIAPFNGSGYTQYQTKAQTGTAAKFWAEQVGGDYVVDARLNASSGTGGWQRNIGDRTYRDLFNSVASGASTRVQLSNNINTSVSVQVSGVWRSM